VTLFEVLDEIFEHRAPDPDEAREVVRMLRAVTDALPPGIGPRAALAGDLMGAADLLGAD
jgi:hypothetical protein